MENFVEGLSHLEGITGAVIAGKDGLLFQTSFDDTEISENLGGMAAALFGTITQYTSGGLGTGNMKHSTIECSQGIIHLTDAGEFLLVVSSEVKNINLGLIRLHMTRTAKRIRQKFEM